MNKNNIPEFQKEVFECPHCKTTAQQTFATDKSMLKDFIKKSVEDGYYEYRIGVDANTQKNIADFLNEIFRVNVKEYINSMNREGVSTSKCASCHEYLIWFQKENVHPKMLRMPEASDDMPPKVRDIYNEARGVEPASYRAAAALLRLAIEELLNELKIKPKEKKLYFRIKHLQEEGKLPDEVIDGLNAVRIAGNLGVHPGEINLLEEDSEATLYQLFDLINFIVDRMISEPKRAEEISKKFLKNKESAGSKA